jgi:hypothetical protein
MNTSKKNITCKTYDEKKNVCQNIIKHGKCDFKHLQIIKKQYLKKVILCIENKTWEDWIKLDNFIMTIKKIHYKINDKNYIIVENYKNIKEKLLINMENIENFKKDIEYKNLYEGIKIKLTNSIINNKFEDIYNIKYLKN